MNTPAPSGCGPTISLACSLLGWIVPPATIWADYVWPGVVTAGRYAEFRTPIHVAMALTLLLWFAGVVGGSITIFRIRRARRQSSERSATWKLVVAWAAILQGALPFIPGLYFSTRYWMDR